MCPSVTVAPTYVVKSLTLTIYCTNTIQTLIKVSVHIEDVHLPFGVDLRKKCRFRGMLNLAIFASDAGPDIDWSCFEQQPHCISIMGAGYKSDKSNQGPLQQTLASIAIGQVGGPK